MRKLTVLVLAFILSTFLCFSISEEVDRELKQFEDLERTLGITEEEDTLSEFFYKLSLPKVNGENKCAIRDKYKIPKFFQFIPSLKAKVFKVGDKVEFENYCFQKNVVTLTAINKDSVELNLFTDKPISKLCTDIYMFHTTAIKHMKNTFMKGDHYIKIKDLKPINIQEIELGGLRLFTLCENIGYTISSAYKTVKLVLSDYPKEPNSFPSIFGKKKSAEEQEQEHKDFLNLFAGFNIEQRYGWEDKIIDLKSQIKTGDFLGLSQVINGESCLIQYVTGGRISHSSIALWIDGELYVAESGNTGVMINTYEDFIQEQVDTYHSVAWFPLSDESRAKIDKKKMVDYLVERKGWIYGFKNFVFAQVDSKTNGFPEYMDIEALTLVVSLLEKVKKNYSDLMIGFGMNMRLGTNNLTISQLGEEITRRGKTFEDVLVEPERDHWKYYDGENLVCSTYVVGAYKASGLFDGLDINAHEFTPKDIYMMDIFRKNVRDKRPKECMEADPELDYCQIMGKFRINAVNFSSVPLYSGMNEKCSCQPPTYFRPTGC